MKKRFISAFCWLFGTTKSEAEKAYSEATPDYISAVIITFDSQCNLAFCFD